jgi:adenosylcobinamide-phosphate synthase
MSLLSVLLALVLEQARPLSVMSWVVGPLSRFATMLEGRFNDGQQRHGRLAWFLGVALPVMIVGITDILLWYGSYPLLSFLLGVLALYLTMGFRQFSHFYSDLQLALRMGETEQARRLLAEWRGRSGDQFNVSEISRLAIEQALVSSHRHVFAPLFWFALLGPAGALLYRMALFFAEQWGSRTDPDFGHFGDFSRRAFAWIDWLPVRVSAIGFAIVGDFEDAVTCWRTQAARWSDPSIGILLASGAGAIGVRLGMPIREGAEIGDRPELGVGDEADPDFMQSTVGLVWRTLVLGLLLLALLWVASWVS